MTTLAVLADIHGNSLALQAVLADLKTQGEVDILLVLGDLAVFGPDPLGVADLLQQQTGALYVRGNTDRYLAEERYPAGDEATSWKAQVLASFPWTARQLGREGVQFLGNLPTQQLLRVGPHHTLLAVHGSPRNDEENIHPHTPDDALAVMLGYTPYNLLLCGHTHIPLDRTIAQRRVVNVGSVGLPFNGDPRASYALIKLQPWGSYEVRLRQVAYNIEAVIDQLKAVNHPTADISAYNLRTARPLGQRLIYPTAMRWQSNPRVQAMAGVTKG